MPPSEALNDDYVASVLKRDAEAHRDRYVTSGLGSLLGSSKRSGDAPRPNTRFLNHLVREVDSHNASLKAKEEEERRVRRKRKIEEPEPDRRGEKRKKGERSGRWASAFVGLGSSSEKLQERRGRREERGEERYSQRERRPRERSRDGERRHHRRSNTDSRKRVVPRSMSPPPDSRKRHGKRSHWQSKDSRPRSRSRSRSRSLDQRGYKNDDIADRKDNQSDSDPLESLLGPAPPPSVVARGRGAFKPSTIDSRFSSDYNPKTDVSLSEDMDERDDWDMALGALRDRTKWRAQGADRLRAAGFTDDEISKWEKGGEKDVEDVRWRKKGEGREWDRGKVLDKDGGVGLKAAWAT